ncbi:MAG: extracellular solute-binding protein [Eubacteriales bacterium]|nr:extracellular solute-binding protein [Eubacteriales bacterium]
MKRLILAVAFCFLAGMKGDGSALSGENEGKENIRELSWFSDWNYWEPQEWDLSPESQTGKITEKTGVKISYMIPADNGDSRLSLMLISGDVPDIISVSDERMIKHLIQSEAVWNLEELFDAYLPESHLIRDYPDDIKTMLEERDGGWYGLAGELHSADNMEKYGEPEEFYRRLREQGENLGIIWNRALLKRLGLSESRLRTEKQIQEAFALVEEREVTVNAVKVTPLLVDGQRYQDTTLQFLADSFGASAVDEQGQYRERMCTEEGKKAMSFLNGAFRKGYADPKQVILTPYQIKRQLNSGQVLCFIGDIYHSGIDPAQWVSSGVVLDEEGKNPLRGIAQKTDCGTMTTFVSRDCEDPEAAARWLDEMTSTEGMRAYLESGERWWPFWNEDWYYSVQKEPDAEQIAWDRLLCAYARSPEVVCYNREPLEFTPEEGWLREVETKVQECREKGIHSAVLAESEAEFSEAFEHMKEELQESGIALLEKARTARLQNTGVENNQK